MHERRWPLHQELHVLVDAGSLEGSVHHPRHHCLRRRLALAFDIQAKREHWVPFKVTPELICDFDVANLNHRGSQCPLEVFAGRQPLTLQVAVAGVAPRQHVLVHGRQKGSLHGGDRPCSQDG
eukprot:CAMPEP_0180176012 /NCGR_PEP_ID=MMETSP0986-20121125/37043_1 /TAXON_ID=697907 /ORGANISM="non described non described, Strain CCMP2293" /LENGTH=122 /DNA_ID=CAMNT_0022128561 /DNA_START=208 /DNA_END=576 /DNA_ORIENTATION=-